MDKKNNCQQQPDSAKSNHKWTVMNILMIMFVLVLILVMGWPLYRDYMRNALLSQALNNLGDLAKEQKSFQEDPQRGAGRFASSFDELTPKLSFSFYADDPGDCNDSLWYSLTHEQKRKTNGRWACDGDFAYGISSEDKCEWEIIGTDAILHTVAHVVPVSQGWIYPDDLKKGACITSDLRLFKQ